MKADFNFRAFRRIEFIPAYTGSRTNGATKVVASRKIRENNLSTATEYLIRANYRISWAKALPR
jgi:hypothetical protein